MRSLKRLLPWPTRQLAARRARDYALVSAALVGLVASTIGIPVVERARKAGDQAFPCQDRACGCTTAEACWRGCCCSSPSERVAWAKAHGVRPPEELLEQVRQLAPSDSAPTGDEAAAASGTDAASNNSDTAAASTAAATADPAHKACCHKDHNRVAKHDSSSNQTPCEAAPHHEKLHVAWIVGSLASKCRGQTLAGGSAFVALPPTPAICWSFDWHVVERLPSTSEQFTSLSFPPPVPPPRG